VIVAIDLLIIDMIHIFHSYKMETSTAFHVSHRERAMCHVYLAHLDRASWESQGCVSHQVAGHVRAMCHDM
jgi:hypothetical protein